MGLVLWSAAKLDWSAAVLESPNDLLDGGRSIGKKPLRLAAGRRLATTLSPWSNLTDSPRRVMAPVSQRSRASAIHRRTCALEV